MALAVDTPDVAPSRRVFIDEADGNVAFGTAESSWRDWSTTQSNPSDGTTTASNNRIIDFNVTSFGDNRVILTSDYTHVINWRTNSPSVTIESALWLGNVTDSRGEAKEVFRKEANSSFEQSSTSDSNGESSPPSTRAKREERVILGSNSLSLPVGELDLKYADANMYIKLVWTSGDQSGTTTSGVFAVFNGTVPSEEYYAIVKRIKNLTTGDDAQLNGSEEHDDLALPPDTGSAETSALPSPTAIGNVSVPAIGPNGVGSSSGGTGGSSLPPGAIAGIVIGSIFGLFSLAFLVWFLLRRRRRAHHVSNGTYGCNHRPHEYLADKEAHTRVTESPHSPYSDDGQQTRQQQEQDHYLQHGGPGTAVGAPERSPLTPYVEEEHMPIAARSTEDISRRGVPSSTPNAATNVSHLIEDGMTEEEIRQLEDEERALDDAIEQAGQGQGQGRGRKP
ncbi:hypothetical protein LZ32DRAFT_386458 [Colletotrichum eremochloae]|nr:hypothetical protein LZ32DRAFT_386458 [Colletotrichum eremochloae]